MCYEQPVVLYPIDPEADLAEVDAKEEDVAPAASQIVGVSQVMVVRDHLILDNTALMSKVSSCLQGVDFNTDIDVFVQDQVIAAKLHLVQCLEQRLRCLDADL